jgi:acyl-[acyl-carrier-protein] desaturase
MTAVLPGQHAAADLPPDPARLELLRSLEPFVAERLQLLAPINKAWQPSDYLPDFAAPDWREQLDAFRAPAQALSDEFLVCLVGGMITEEALPNYAVSLNHIAGDWTGTSERPWARWLRGWTAEENRHGDLLNAYLRLTGRVDMRTVEVTVQHLIARGFNPRAHPDPYAGLVYTAFQERATAISHANVGRQAAREGDTALASICKRIAGDESRHEAFYKEVMGRVVREDPAAAVLSMRALLGAGIAMPGRLMTDGCDPALFDHFAAVAQRCGVYTVSDYGRIIAHLVEVWGLAGLSLSGDAAKAQDYLCRQCDRYEALAESVAEHLARQPRVKFAWIFGREA